MCMGWNRGEIKIKITNEGELAWECFEGDAIAQMNVNGEFYEYDPIAFSHHVKWMNLAMFLWTLLK
jgi:hypothetical protein